MSIIDSITAKGEAFAGSRTLRHFHVVMSGVPVKDSQKSLPKKSANDSPAFFTHIISAFKTGQNKVVKISSRTKG